MVAELQQVIERLVQERTPSRSGSEDLARVRATARVREDLVETAEAVVDEAIEAARRRAPVGHTLGEIGAELGLSSQAVGQRIRGRGLVADRALPPAEPRADRLRRQRAEQDARIRAGWRWRGRPLRALADDHGRITGYLPDDATGDEHPEPVHHRPPRSRRHGRTTPRPDPRTASPLPARSFASAYERARAAAGAAVFRPELVHRTAPRENP